LQKPDITALRLHDRYWESRTHDSANARAAGGGAVTLSGKRIFITGAASGIGAALTSQVAGLGARVVAADRDAAALAALRERLPGVGVVAGDIGSRTDVARMLALCDAELGGLDIVIQNAGVAFWYDRVPTVDAAERIEEEIRSNLLGPVLVAAASLPLLAREKAATLCIVTSGLAYAPLHCYPVYSATKAALHSFAHSLRAKAPRNVRVLEMLPPFVDTPLVTGIAAFKITPETVARAIVRSITGGRRERAIGVARLLPFSMRLVPRLTESVLQLLAWKTSDEPRSR